MRSSMNIGILQGRFSPAKHPPHSNTWGWGHSRWLKAWGQWRAVKGSFNIQRQCGAFKNISGPNTLLWKREKRIQSQADTMFLDAKLLLIAYLLGQAIALVDPLHSSVSVKTRNGTVIGINDERSEVQRFLGIPYAQHPVGDLRLRHAIPLNTSFDTLHAQSFGPACYGPEIDSNPDSSEECLTLNIWRPVGQSKDNALRPVMVWFYGGGLRTGYTVRDC